MANIITLKLGMVNVYLIKGTEGYVLVDAGVKGYEGKILKKARKFGVQPQEIKAIVITHCHEDHIGAIEALVEQTGAKTIVNLKEYTILSEGMEDQITPLSFLAKIIMKVASKMMKNVTNKVCFKADICVEKEYDLSEYGIEGSIIMTPGHTQGSQSILLKSGEAIIGDHLMAMMPWNKPGKPMLAYDIQAIKVSMNDLMKRGATRFYLSHGKDYSKILIQKGMEKF